MTRQGTKDIGTSSCVLSSPTSSVFTGVVCTPRGLEWGFIQCPIVAMVLVNKPVVQTEAKGSRQDSIEKKQRVYRVRSYCSCCGKGHCCGVGGNP